MQLNPIRIPNQKKCCQPAREVWLRAIHHALIFQSLFGDEWRKSMKRAVFVQPVTGLDRDQVQLAHVTSERTVAAATAVFELGWRVARAVCHLIGQEPEALYSERSGRDAKTTNDRVIAPRLLPFQRLTLELTSVHDICRSGA